MELFSSHCINTIWCKYSTYHPYDSHKYFITGENLLWCWDFIVSFFKNVACVSAFSLAFQLCCPWQFHGRLFKVQKTVREENWRGTEQSDKFLF